MQEANKNIYKGSVGESEKKSLSWTIKKYHGGTDLSGGQQTRQAGRKDWCPKRKDKDQPEPTPVPYCIKLQHLVTFRKDCLPFTQGHIIHGPGLREAGGKDLWLHLELSVSPATTPSIKWMNRSLCKNCITSWPSTQLQSIVAVASLCLPILVLFSPVFHHTH